MSRTGRRVIGVVVMAVVSFVVWDQAEARALAREIAAIAARGELVPIADPEAVSLTTEERDAARLYAGAAERAAAAAREDGFRVSRVDVDNAAAPADLPALEAKYRSNAPALQLLDQAVPLQFREFGSEAPELNSNQSSLRHLADVNDVRADLLAARGQGDAAASTLVASARLLRTMPITSYRYGASAHILASLRILFRRSPPGEASLAALARELASFPDTDTLAAEVLRMRARFLDDLDQPAASPLEAIVNRLTRPWRTRETRRHLAAYEESLALARVPWPAKFEAARRFEARYASVFQQPRRPGWWDRTIKSRGPAVVPIGVNAAGLDLASRRLAIAAVAVERYRRAHAEAPPAMLDALVPAYLPAVPLDPFTGAPLIYRTTSKDYALYSVDIDQKDDGGALYGRGSLGQIMARVGQPRDLGIRVAR